ncbi:MAG: 30S ribosomal protein S20 [Gemmatimonadales bacterium]
MPRTKSAKKAMRQTRARTARNKSQRSALRTALKKARASVGAREQGAALRGLGSLLDRAARKRLIHPNTAARLKSRISRKRGG